MRPLLMKELREVLSGRALWTTLLILCPLVGYSFFQAVSLYSEASASARDSPVMASGLSPLDGVLVPSFGALYLAVTLLFPFVAIRTLGHEKETGALRLLVQLPYRVPTLIAEIRRAGVIDMFFRTRIGTLGLGLVLVLGTLGVLRADGLSTVKSCENNNDPPEDIAKLSILPNGETRGSDTAAVLIRTARQKAREGKDAEAIRWAALCVFDQSEQEAIKRDSTAVLQYLKQ
jgi:hypothetical protein